MPFGKSRLGTTKCNGMKDTFDRFFTMPETVDRCLKLVDLSSFDCIIEPSAGAGAFSDKLKGLPADVFAFDIRPSADGIEKADWFLLDKFRFVHYGKILVIGNPPFGQQGKTAIDFFNEAATIADTIAFVLPASFCKDSMKNRLNARFHLENELFLGETGFDVFGKTEPYMVNCVFQVWKKRPYPRKVETKETVKSSFVEFTDRAHADFSIRRVGANAGKASDRLDFSESSNYFCRNISGMPTLELVDAINGIDFDMTKYAVGPKSLSKRELVETMERELGK